MWDFLTSKSSCYSCNAFCLLLLCLAQLLLASDYSLNVCLNKYQYWIIQSAELFILFAFLQQSTILLVFVVLRSFDSSFRKWARQLFQQVLGLFSVHQLCQSKGTCSDFSACVDCWGTNNSNICSLSWSILLRLHDCNGSLTKNTCAAADWALRRQPYDLLEKLLLRSSRQIFFAMLGSWITWWF